FSSLLYGRTAALSPAASAHSPTTHSYTVRQIGRYRSASPDRGSTDSACCLLRQAWRNRPNIRS
ncbi:hypothetical protein P9314_16775, partial [Paenibacillus validus]|uniref:hypothetical protein n=1 Tax=Paenibacillus validus TaxID=44253 RepID=UPI002E1C0FB9|nr:hypothetical protein [Paenibacillus validus]